MKKILFFAFAAALFIGCSKKDSNNPTPKNSTLIVGKWYVNADSVTATINGVKQTIEPNNYNDSYEFNSDGSGLYTPKTPDPDSQDVFTFTISNNVITFNVAALTVNNQTEPSYIKVATIKKLTSTQLVITITGTDDGTAYTEVIYLSKVQSA